MEPSEEKMSLKKWFLNVRIYIGSVDREMGEKSKWLKFTSLTHHIRSEFGFQNLRSIVIQNETFRRNKVTKKMVLWRKDLHRKWRLGNGGKSQNGQNSRV